jgi:hypothetical protein
MANSNGWGDGAANNAIGWGQGANNAIGWGDIHADSYAGLTDIVGITTDPDAQAFITAAAITDPTQQAAINTLVVDLKGYNIWTKMKAVYPMVGGTATTHKFNLKNPLDTNAAFRVFFSGGATHSSNGVQFNGSNSYGDTFIIPNNNLSLNSVHLSYYSRTNITGGGLQVEMGVNEVFKTCFLTYGSTFKALNRIEAMAGSTFTPTNGFLIGSRNTSTTEKYYHKGSLINTLTVNSNSLSTLKIFLGAASVSNLVTYPSAKQCAFASIGDGLTDTEAANFYTAVQAFQTTLGRSIGTQTVSDADAQAFVTAADIQDQVEANAINNLVIGMKADGLWTKMQAVYPFVGSTASQHKFNLKDPRDLDAAFRLVFSGGWTHSSTGALPNGTNAFADTKCKTVTDISVSSHSFGIYSRTNDTTGSQGYGVFSGAGFSTLIQHQISTGNFYDGDVGNTLTYTANPTTSLLMLTRRSSSDWQAYRAGVSLGTRTTVGGVESGKNFFFGARNTGDNISASNFTKNQISFAFIGDGLTNTESGNLYTAVQAFQTALNRNI